MNVKRRGGEGEEEGSVDVGGPDEEQVLERRVLAKRVEDGPRRKAVDLVERLVEVRRDRLDLLRGQLKVS